MKLNKFFTITLAALAMTACSKDDAPAGNGQSEIVDAISVKIVESGTPATRAESGTEAGKGTENAVYSAFIFAKEVSPEHPGAMVGDWTVKQITGNAGAAIPSGNSNAADGNVKGSSLANMCTFNNVRQGDNIYVIANDPTLTIEQAETDLAHKGEASEAAIKSYIANVTKEYLNSLTIKADEKTAPSKSFIMAGMTTIPTSPNLSITGNKVTVPVSLERELAKVKFAAAVTADVANEAAGKVKIETAAGKEDGIIVVRIPRKVSFFTQMDRDWYFPSLANNENKDWDVTNWKNPFHGDTQDGSGADAVAGSRFNDKPFNDLANEYRMTWQLKNDKLSDGATLMTFKDGASADNPIQGNNTMVAPIFYTTPNYANTAGCATVICTQATIAKDIMINDLTGNKPLQSLYDKLLVIDNAAIKALNATWSTPDNINKFVTYVKDAKNAANVKSALNDIYSLNKDNTEIEARYKSVTAALPTAASATELRFKAGDKVYYRADVSDYVDGASLKVTKRNTYYETRATITSVGAKSIEKAINSDDLQMQIEVSVKPWTHVINDIDM